MAIDFQINIEGWRKAPANERAEKDQSETRGHPESDLFLYPDRYDPYAMLKEPCR
jgi:hypothetical protein